VSTHGHAAYAQTRLQARLGEMPDAAELQQTMAARDLASLLAAVRGTTQRRYAARLAPGMDPHELERHLRFEWTSLVDEVARWQPATGFAAVSWLRWLPSLPLLQKLARGGRPPAWARADTALGRIVATEPALRGAALAGTPLRAFSAALATDGGGDIRAAWVAHWRAVWPQDRRAMLALERIVRDVAVCEAALREPTVRDSAEPHAVLARRLLRTFRRNPSSPAAAVAYLGLEGLGLLALRGGVMQRAVVEPGPA
jgi:hypothetical protein